MEENWDDNIGVSQVYENKSNYSPAPSSYDNWNRDQNRGSRGGDYTSRSSNYNRNIRGNYRSSDNSYSGQHRSNYRGDRDREDRDRDDRDRGHRDNCGGGRQYNSGRLSEIMEIERNLVGMVIGKGGSNIREISSKFSVNVNVDKNPNYHGMVSVTITGRSQSDIDDAVSHLKEQCYGGQSRDGKYSSDRNRRRDESSNDNYRSQGNGFSSNSYRNTRDESPEKEFVQIDWEGLNKIAEEERAARWAKCPKLIKNLYYEHPEVAALTVNEVERIREDNNNITVDRVFKDEAENVNAPIPNPVFRFEHCFSKYPDLLQEIQKQGFEKPSPIQTQAWPVILKGEDLIGIAQTGTGKTLAFLLPAMIHTEYQPVPRTKRGGPNVLVLAPTRELAQQIEKEVGKYSFRGMKAVCIYGGGDRNEQIDSVAKGVEIVIATPGRLQDLVYAKKINISSITYLVLDEADRMLDMGFEPQIRKLLIDIRPDRQTIMTSATWPPGVCRLAQRYMNNPVQICVGSLDLAAVHTVNQCIEIIQEDKKFFRILKFVEEMDRVTDKAIIFCGRKARADDLSSELTLKGIICACIHGSCPQSDREQAIADITSGEIRILIATDIASRGLDIDDITYVVNYDFPRNIEEYVHRVGRTGRAGKRGTSISLVTHEDWGSAKELISILKEANQNVPIELQEMADRFKAMKQRRANEAAKFRFDRKRGRGDGGDGRIY